MFWYSDPSLSDSTQEGRCRTSRAAKNSPVGKVVVVVVVVVAGTPGGTIIIHCCKHRHIKTYASVSAYKTENLAVSCHIYPKVELLYDQHIMSNFAHLLKLYEFI